MLVCITLWMTHLLNVGDAEEEEEEEKNCVNAEHMSQNKIFPVIIFI